MYLSHFMYRGLVTFTYIVVLLFSIYMMVYVVSPLSHVLVFFLSLYTRFFFYITCLYFTFDTLMNLV